MRWIAVSLVALVGCGRLEFDPDPSRADASASRFTLIVAGATWAQAVAACEQQQPPAHLATISDLTDNQAAAELAATIPFASSQTNTNQRQRMWLGGNSLATVGVWVWHHGEPFTYANWRVGQPGSPTIERCLILLGSENGVWDDRPCTTSYEAFLCARD